MKRHSDKLSSTAPTKVDVNRVKWANMENIKKMYDILYEEMVDAGIAEKLEQEVWVNRKGEVVSDELEAFVKKQNTS